MATRCQGDPHQVSQWQRQSEFGEADRKAGDSCTGCRGDCCNRATHDAPVPDRGEAERNGDGSIDARHHDHQPGAAMEQKHLIAEMRTQIADRTSKD